LDRMRPVRAGFSVLVSSRCFQLHASSLLEESVLHPSLPAFQRLLGCRVVRQPVGPCLVLGQASWGAALSWHFPWFQGIICQVASCEPRLAFAERVRFLTTPFPLQIHQRQRLTSQNRQ
ncbi:UNVERIFIED_CONTAM: hypothetical protein K2H54_065670, partial [Gekko kuhli]